MLIPARTDYKLAPVGAYRGVLCDVIDMGDRDDAYKPGQKVRMMQYAFQTEHLMEDGIPHVVRTFPMTQKFPGNTKLTKFTKAMIGRKFTAEEEDDFDFDGLIGKNFLIEVTHNQAGDGKWWANVVKATPIEGDTLKVTSNYVRMQDREQNVA